MMLTARVQTLVDELVQQLGLQALRPSGIEINLDASGIVQDVKPKLTYRRRKDDQPPKCCDKPMAFDFDLAEFVCTGKCGRRTDRRGAEKRADAVKGQ